MTSRMPIAEVTPDTGNPGLDHAMKQRHERAIEYIKVTEGPEQAVTLSEVKDRLVNYIEFIFKDSSQVTRLADINVRYHKAAKKFDTTTRKIVEALINEGRLSMVTHRGINLVYSFNTMNQWLKDNAPSVEEMKQARSEGNPLPNGLDMQVVLFDSSLTETQKIKLGLVEKKKKKKD